MQIVTTKGDVIRNELLGIPFLLFVALRLQRGTGAIQKEKKDILMMVVTRYETLHVKKIVRKHDEDAFINIYETVEVDRKIFGELGGFFV